MTHDRKPPRQPLFWAALAFSLGAVGRGAGLAAAFVVGDRGAGFRFAA